MSFVRPRLAPRALVPPELARGDWADVTRRVRPRRRLLTMKVAVAFALFVVLAAAATATYLILRGQHTKPAPGALTVITGGYGPTNSCRDRRGSSRGASRAGVALPAQKAVRRLAHEHRLGSRRPVPRLHARLVRLQVAATDGLHILDTANRPGLSLCSPARSLGSAVSSHSVYWSSFTAVAWSPDSRTFALNCTRGIYLIRSDGSGPRRLPTATVTRGWPTWSPDGKHIAFKERHAGRTCCSIYVMGLGRHGPRSASSVHGTATRTGRPDGRRIAYSRTATGSASSRRPASTSRRPAGASRRAGRPPGRPTARGLRSRTLRGVYLVPAAGGRARLATTAGGGRVFDLLRPAWYPARRAPRHAQGGATCGDC